MSGIFTTIKSLTTNDLFSVGKYPLQTVQCPSQCSSGMTKWVPRSEWLSSHPQGKTMINMSHTWEMICLHGMCAVQAALLAVAVGCRGPKVALGVTEVVFGGTAGSGPDVCAVKPVQRSRLCCLRRRLRALRCHPCRVLKRSAKFVQRPSQRATLVTLNAPRMAQTHGELRVPIWKQDVGAAGGCAIVGREEWNVLAQVYHFMIGFVQLPDVGAGTSITVVSISGHG